MSIGERIKDRRSDINMTQVELVEAMRRLGCASMCIPQTVAKIEAGRRNVKTDELRALTKALGVSLEWLVFGDGEAEAEGSYFDGYQHGYAAAIDAARKALAGLS